MLRWHPDHQQKRENFCPSMSCLSTQSARRVWFHPAQWFQMPSMHECCLSSYFYLPFSLWKATFVGTTSFLVTTPECLITISHTGSKWSSWVLSLKEFRTYYPKISCLGIYCFELKTVEKIGNAGSSFLWIPLICLKMDPPKGTQWPWIPSLGISSTRED